MQPTVDPRTGLIRLETAGNGFRAINHGQFNNLLNVAFAFQTYFFNS